MAGAMNEDRRGFLGTTLKSIAGAHMGMLGSLLHRGHPVGPVTGDGELQSLVHATEWLNSPALTAEALRGNVVLIDFWTYTCINWLRTFPWIRAWANKYRDRGLVVISVHAPEFSFEHDLDNVRRAVRELGVEHPVAVDNEFAIWRAFRNQYWPAIYVVDARGVIRHNQFGEGDYERAERVIQDLLAEAGLEGAGNEAASVEGQGVEAAADWGNLRSPETYLGYLRTENFASPGGARSDARRAYTFPQRLRRNQWALSGEWTVEREATVLHQAGGALSFDFHARDLHLVMGSPKRGARVRFRVSIDSQPPGAARGLDVDAQGEGITTYQRMYQLIRQPKPIEGRRFEIAFLDPGVEVFAFTFG